MSSLTGRLAGICAVLFVVMMVVGVFLGFDSPDSDAPDQEWIDYMKDDNNLVRNLIGGYLLVIAGIMFLILLVAMYQRIRRAEGDGGWSMVMLVTGIGWTMGLIIGAILIQTIPGGIKFGNTPEPGAELARWLAQLGFGVILVAGGLCAALMSAVMSTLILRTKVLPPWLGYFGFLAALAMLFAAFFLPVIIFLLWTLAIGIVLIMSTESEGSTATA